MSATRPTGPAPARAPDRARAGPQPAALLAAEVALALVTVAAVAGIARLFDGAGWVGPCLANAIAAHLFASLARRRGLTIGETMPAALVAAALGTVWTVYPATTIAGLPTSSTVSTLVDDLAAAWDGFGVLVAPAPLLVGFVAACVLAVWVIAMAADWLAFRARMAIEAVLPAGTMFVFVALLGTGRGRVWTTVAFAAATLAFVLVHRTGRQVAATGAWVAGTGERGRRWLVGAGAASGALAILAGSVVGPNLPGANADALVETRGDNDARRVTVSPLVEVKARLVEQSDVEAFRVRATEPSYWRLTALDDFDGRSWTRDGSYREAQARLASAERDDPPTRTVRQRFQVTGLAAIWLPAAFEARGFSSSTTDARFDAESSTLIVPGERETGDGSDYQVVSAVPVLDPDTLRATATEPDRDELGRYRRLPEGFSERILAEARRVTAGAPSDYDRALALQDHLRTFAYDLDVAAGSGIRDMEEFLFVRRRGYCEQFAATFAAMARAVGLPARVAVGFTPGELDGSSPDASVDGAATYIVRGENAHAWPEVHLPGAGWVAFEPTPGRGAPGDQSYTGVAPAQAVPGQPTRSEPPTAPSASPTTEPEGATTTNAPDRVRITSPDELGDPSPSESERSAVDRYVVDPLGWIAVAAGTAVAIAAVATPATIAVGLARRRRRAGQEPGARVRLAERELAEALAALGLPADPASSAAQRAERIASVLPGSGEPAATVTAAGDAARFSAAGISSDDADSAVAAASALVAAARARLPRWRRIAAWFDLRRAVRLTLGGPPRSTRAARRRVETAVRGA